MKQKFKLTSTKLQEPILVTYFNSYLNIVEIGFKSPMSEFQFDQFIRLLPYKLDIDKFRILGLSVEEVVEVPANKKIAMFCSAYEKHKGIKYKATRRDGGLIKNIVITEAILNHYFNSNNWNFKGKHSVINMVNYYNELLQEIASIGKSKYPNTWSKEYESKLSSNGLKEYWSHLRSKGLKPKKNSVGVTINWE